METFQTFTEATGGQGLTIFDIDKTLFTTDTKVHIKKDGKIINKEYIGGGMRPKINTCVNAINNGVKEATILDGRIPHSIILELFTEHGIGTQIYS